MTTLHQRRHQNKTQTHQRVSALPPTHQQHTMPPVCSVWSNQTREPERLFLGLLSLHLSMLLSLFFLPPDDCVEAAENDTSPVESTLPHRVTALIIHTIPLHNLPRQHPKEMTQANRWGEGGVECFQCEGSAQIQGKSNKLKMTTGNWTFNAPDWLQDDVNIS